MGSGRFDSNAYRSFTSSTVGKTTEQIYTSKAIHKDLDPKGVKLRESRDSADNPNSTPLIVDIDVTGSMGILADVIARKGLGTLFESILDRKPISDPHVMFMANGDANYDRAPLQVSQFEADVRIIKQLSDIYLEHGGGGNGWESYNLPWYFAAFHTEHDSLIKRGKKGYLFTIGDEEAPGDLTKAQIKNIIGDDLEAELSSKDMLALAQRKYNCYHIVITEGSHCRSYRHTVLETWKSMIGEHLIVLEDHTQLAETIVSAIEVAEGRDAAESTKAWSNAKAVHEAVKNLPKGSSPKLLGR